MIQSLNHLGANFADFARSMLVQSTLLIVTLFLLDLVLRKRVRAAVRYPLWMLVLVKLVLPPSFAAPTGLAYWLPETKIVKPSMVITSPVVVHYAETGFVEPHVLQTLPPPRPRLQAAAVFLLTWLVIALGLVGWLVRRSHSVARTAARAAPASKSPEELLEACRQQMGIQRRVRLKLSTNAGSPAVCGLWRPIILIPRALAGKLTPLQLRAVLFHELAHIQRGDVWVNYAQTLLQILYWWHPLLWLANAQIRRAREQAVDERVMVEMGGEAEAYPATLLEVAKLASKRPMPALGLIGIVESKSALAQRIRHLLDSPAPKSAKLGFARLAAVALIGAVLLPMARGQRGVARPNPGVNTHPEIVSMTVKFAELTDPALEAVSLGSPTVISPNGHQVWVLPPEDDLIARMQRQPDTSILYAPSVTTRSGQQAQISVTEPQDFNGHVIQVGPFCELLPEVSGDWIDLAVIAKVTEFGEVVPDQLNGLQLRPKQSNGSGKPEEGEVRSVNATGYIIHDVGAARVSVVNEGFVVLQNPEVKSINGKRILVVVSPRIVGQTAYASPPDPNAVSITGSSSSTALPRVETNLLPTPTAKSAQAQPPGPAPKDNAGERVPEILVRPGQNPRIETNRLEVAKNLFEEIRIPTLGFDWFLGDDLLSEPDFRQGRVPVLGDLPFVGRLFRSQLATSGRKAIQAKLNRIVLPEVVFDNVALPEALRWLAKEARDRDPDGTGVNFLFNPNVIGAAPRTTVDPNTGEQLTLPPPEPLELSNVGVRINPPLKNVRLGDALEAIVKVADKPIRYAITEYAVVISQRLPDTKQLETRIFRFDPKTFFEDAHRFLLDAGLTDIEIFGHSNDWKVSIIRKLCESLGASHAPPNAVFYSEGKGFLMVRATRDELERVQKAIERFKALRPKEAPTQITVEAKFLEMPTDAARKVGLDIPPPNATTNLWTRSLTAAQARAVLHAASQHAGVDTLSAPRITTLSGRQAQIQAVEIKPVVSGIAPEALGPPGVRSTISNSAQFYLTSQVLCGPTLDLVPHVAADGYTIHLTASPQVTEFLRYDTTLNGAKATRVWVDGRQHQVALPRPVTRHRSMHAAVDVYDGQTLVLANPLVTVVSKQPTGESVTNAVAEEAGKRLLVFITPTIIDPAGNPIHTSGKEPFPTDKTPQPPR
jgi:beta-lactamase regulating signal transducer with metallopeptidase domain